MKAKEKIEEIKQQMAHEIIKQLEQGTVPWDKPWFVVNAQNPIGKYDYKGSNKLYLNIVSSSKGQGNFWATFKQISNAGGMVNKGSKGNAVIFWSFIMRGKKTKQKLDAKKIKALNLTSLSNAELNEKGYEKVWFEKYSVVFNIDDTNLKFESESKQENTITDDGLIAWAESNGNIPYINFGGQRAFYDRMDDFIQLPLLKKFKSRPGFNGTILHEIIHSTGHKNRLNRFGNDAPIYFGSQAYSAEELVAEIGSVILGKSLGVDVEIEQSAAYVKSWLKALKDDNTMIWTAANKAEKAVNFLVG